MLRTVSEITILQLHVQRGAFGNPSAFKSNCPGLRKGQKAWPSSSTLAFLSLQKRNFNFNWEGKVVMSMQEHSQETMGVDEDDHLPEMGQAWLILCKKRDLIS